MTELLSTVVFIGALFLFLGMGVWVGIALLATAALGMFMFTSVPLGSAMTLTIWSSQSSWTLTALPLFIWMGEILALTNIAGALFRGLAPMLRRLPGGLLHVNIGASAIFAAISGSSAATVTTVGKMSLPELKRQGYPDRIAIGTLSGAGTLGLLIPPSISMIVYGVTVNESISKLFMASMLPGVCLAIFFFGYVVIWSKVTGMKPLQIKGEEEDSSRMQRFIGLAPVLLLIGSVIGSIYTGIATATEAAAIGVLGSLLIAKMQGGLTWKTFQASVMGGVRTSAMIMLILMGAGFLNLAMGFTGIPAKLAGSINELHLSPLMLIAMLTVFYIALGCFLDGLSSIVLTMAVIEPMVRAAGFDMLWFGVFLMVVIEMAQITPPVGFNLFVLQGMTGRDMGFLARASLPMFFVMCLFIVFLVLFPGVATWLPAYLS